MYQNDIEMDELFINITWVILYYIFFGLSSNHDPILHAFKFIKIKI